MRKILLLLLFINLSLASYGQQQYNMYMDSLGFEHVSITKTPQVALSGYYTNLLLLPTINAGITRPINSTTFTISTTRTSLVWYNITISCTSTIGGPSTGSVALQYSTNAGSTWTTENTITVTNTITLAIALQAIDGKSMILSGVIPVGALVRMVSSTTGTVTITYLTGTEYY